MVQSLHEAIFDLLWIWPGQFPFWLFLVLGAWVYLLQIYVRELETAVGMCVSEIPAREGNQLQNWCSELAGPPNDFEVPKSRASSLNFKSKTPKHQSRSPTSQTPIGAKATRAVNPRGPQPPGRKTPSCKAQQVSAIISLKHQKASVSASVSADIT